MDSLSISLKNQAVCTFKAPPFGICMLRCRSQPNVLQDALQKENRLVQQYNLVVMNRILTPVQACIFLAEAWPSFCDCLAFTQALTLALEQPKR